MRGEPVVGAHLRADEPGIGGDDRPRGFGRPGGGHRTNAEISSRLYLSEGTVKGVVSRLMTHLDCTNRTQLALLAARGIG
ncbi:helix-turn-helix domain-containing protein [Amycolatopsis sp. RTGN1]|uniref:helix-turn-helix domain-containing protein n=1 Tax=Amycolatopsis ponsaeliensis TaxID=2992142 RepID=UPI00254B4557|nr:helix-turn-helix transcriptional regulator [Amycolatopsis sp. RTGN1]